nr:hypothetical protein OG409_00495 [Streptomyces sp. NBC_00974]WSX54267.1 hypothetical protein OG409_38420 [Streptomyces sp. NBC_00974]
MGGRTEAAEWPGPGEVACRGTAQALGMRAGGQDIKLSGLLHYRSERGAGRFLAVFATQRWSGEPQQHRAPQVQRGGLGRSRRPRPTAGR